MDSANEPSTGTKVILAWLNIGLYSLLSLCTLVLIAHKISKMTEKGFLLTTSVMLLLTYCFQFWRSQ